MAQSGEGERAREGGVAERERSVEAGVAIYLRRGESAMARGGDGDSGEGGAGHLFLVRCGAGAGPHRPRTAAAPPWRADAAPRRRRRLRAPRPPSSAARRRWRGERGSVAADLAAAGAIRGGG